MQRFGFLFVIAAALLLSIRGAYAYEDVLYNFSVTGPDKLSGQTPKTSTWAVVPNASTPGLYRFGWMAKNAVTQKTGASVLVFVQLLDKPYSAKELLDKNLEEMKLKDEKLKKQYYKVVKSSTFQAGANGGFSLEVVGPGTGFSITPGDPMNPPTSSTPQRQIKHAELKVQNIPTHQRWYAVVRGSQLIGVLTTCSESTYKQYSPLWGKVEHSLVVKAAPAQ